MNKKRTVRLSSGAAAVVAVSAGLLAASGMARGLDTTLTLPVQQTETRIQVAQAADVAPVASPVTYSPEQADRGEKRYEKDCTECHGDDLKGGLLGGPPLRGLSFEEKYANGAPAGMMYEVMAATMPPNAPGRYSPSTYADLMAYILKRNGFSAGAELPSDVDALYNLTMEK